MLPDMSDVLSEWSVPVLLKTITVTTVNFVETKTVTGVTIQAVVQPTDQNALVAAGLDTSVKHMTFHSDSQITNGEIIEYNGKDYKIVQDGDWDAYGYSNAVGQWTKKAVLAVTA